MYIIPLRIIFCPQAQRCFLNNAHGQAGHRSPLGRVLICATGMFSHSEQKRRVVVKIHFRIPAVVPIPIDFPVVIDLPINVEVSAWAWIRTVCVRAWVGYVCMYVLHRSAHIKHCPLHMARCGVHKIHHSLCIVFRNPCTTYHTLRMVQCRLHCTVNTVHRMLHMVRRNPHRNPRRNPRLVRHNLRLAQDRRSSPFGLYLKAGSCFGP